uniref:C2H2-type domain-containing protein n=1 Tax=Setaria digitata TaxID=48799 RepID=A0A915PTH8_9BILA
MSRVTKRQKANVKKVERKHSCPSCDARFPFPNKLRLHINSNHSLANICELCPERFNRFNELRTHMRRAHQIIHKCHLCAYSSSVKAEVKKHVIKCHENGVRCTVDGCNATVAYNRLRRHISEFHPNDIKSQIRMVVDNQTIEDSSEPRSFCKGAVAVAPLHHSEAFAGSSLTVQHAKAVAEINSSNCCERIESAEESQIKLDNSGSNCLKDESVRVPLQIPGDLESEDQTTFRKMSFVCIEPGEYACQNCEKIFRDVHNFRRHWNRVHLRIYEERDQSKKYVCKVSRCTQRFSCPSKLQDHTLTAHNKDVLFECGTCKKKLTSRASFAVHLRRYHLVSIRDVPYGFMDETTTNSIVVPSAVHVNS